MPGEAGEQSRGQEADGQDRAGPGEGPRSHQQNDDSCADEDPDDLRFGPRRHQRGHPEDRPQQAVGGEREPRQLHRAPRDDGDDRGPDPVERAPHPRQAAEAQVGHGDRDHHEKRRQHEREADEGGAGRLALRPAQVHGELGGEGSGRELRQREALAVLLGCEPSALLHQIALHVSDERDRSSKAGGAEPQEVEQQLAERERLTLADVDGPAHPPRREMRAWTRAPWGGLRLSFRMSTRLASRESMLVHRPLQAADLDVDLAQPSKRAGSAHVPPHPPSATVKRTPAATAFS